MKIIVCEIEKFHPALRDEAMTMVNRLNACVPPFGRGINLITVAKTWHGKSRMCSMEELGYAMTNHNLETGDNVITMSGFMFGVDGDLDRLKKSKERDKASRFHGNMFTVGSDIAHEYGHAFKGMLRQVFLNERLDKDKLVTNAMAKLDLEFVNSIATTKDGHFNPLAILFGARLYGPDNPYNGKLVSGYAESNPEEAFAETFAAIFCDTGQHDNKTVVMMKSLIKLTYDQINAIGWDKVNDATPMQMRLRAMHKLGKKIRSGEHHPTPEEVNEFINTMTEAMDHDDEKETANEA